MYRSSISKIIQMLIPWGHRKPRFIAWLKVFVSYLAKIQNDLYQLWDRSLIEAYMTPQIMYLEGILNRRYGRTDIWIGEGYTLGPWIWPVGSVPAVIFYLDQADSYVWTCNDQISNVDFVVNIPAALEDEVQYIAAVVQKYKLPGKNFVIQIFA